MVSLGKNGTASSSKVAAPDNRLWLLGTGLYMGRDNEPTLLPSNAEHGLTASR